jgi:hypothetical protein
VSSGRIRASLYGAVAGAVIALAFTALFVGRFALRSVSQVDGRAAFEVTSGALYLLVVIVGALAGLTIGVVAYAFGREAEPDAPRFPLQYLLPVAAATGALFAYAVLRAGLAFFGDINQGMATISVVRMVVVVLVMGVLAGGITSAVVDALARPAFLGLEGEAIPESAGAVMVEMGRALGAPLIALIVGAGFAVGLSQILLAVEGTGAVAIFSVVGALVLGGATLIALRPWERNGGAPQG